MANTNVTLLWRCKTDNGWRRYPALYAKNGRPRAGIVALSGRELEYPTGRFQLRYYAGDQQVYEDAGENPTDALHARQRLVLKLAAKASADAAGVRIEEGAPRRKALLAEFRNFIEDVENRGKMEAAQVYGLAGREFLACVGKVFVDELTRDDLTKYQRKLRDDGYSDRTIHNRHANVCAFLHWLGLDVKKLAPQRPQFEQAVPEAYTLEEMKALFAAVKDPRLALTYEIMLKCGLREQEAMYLEWTSIDFERGKLRVRANAQYAFKVKDKEQRDIPIETELLKRLKAARKKHPHQRLVTGTVRTDLPQTHMLRALKRLVNKAGLQCGSCGGCRRELNPECEHWFLHKFRATYITRLLRGGMDLRTVMKYSGHSDLESVQRYLSPADDESAREVVNRVRWL
jgi:integrase